MHKLLKWNYFFALLILISSIGAFAQKASFENALRVQLRNTGAIVDNNEVKGYYMFYMTDRVDKNTNSYLLRILDANLNEIGSQKIKDTKYLFLQEGAFNGNTIMLKFYEAKERKLVFRRYDNTAKLINKKNDYH